MNEYTMELVNGRIEAERELSAIKTKVDSLMRLVAYEEFRTAEQNKRLNLTGRASIECDHINAIFGWANAAEREEDENGETE